MRIGLIGNFRVPFTTENDLVWSLERLGHEVVRLQEDDYWVVAPLDIDLLIYVHTHGWVTPIDLLRYFEQLEANKIPTVSFHLDYFRGLELRDDRQNLVGRHPFWKTKYVFSADGGSSDWFKERGINHFWLPPGVVERDCYFADPKEEFLHDVIFVGSRAYHPEWPNRPELIDWLHLTYGARFAHYGNDGRKVVRMDELNRLYRSVKIVVGDSINIGYKHPNYWSDRVPETTGRGGFLIHPNVEGLRKYHQSVITYKYGDFNDLKSKIDCYLEDYVRREKLRLKQHIETKTLNTYTERMRTMLNKVAEFEPQIKEKLNEAN